LPNPALFRKHVFESLGGFVDMIEEDRELRNRTLCYGFKYCFVDRPLITKFEEEQSLTLDEGTGFYSGRRVDERSMIKEQAKKMRATVDKVEFEKKFRSVIDLSEVGIEFVSNPKLLRINEAIPSTEGTIKNLREQLDEALYALNSRDIGGRI
jgi:hypothetical protein